MTLEEAKQSVDFVNGIVGRWSEFIKLRHKSPPMWAKAVGTFIVSTGLHNVTLYDDMGPIKPNLFFVNIGHSGRGNKTPIVNRTKDFFTDYYPKMKVQSRFTNEALTRFISPSNVKNAKKEDELEDKKSEMDVAHPNFCFIRDEFSQLLVDEKKTIHGRNRTSPVPNMGRKDRVQHDGGTSLD